MTKLCEVSKTWSLLPPLTALCSKSPREHTRKVAFFLLTKKIMQGAFTCVTKMQGAFQAAALMWRAPLLVMHAAHQRNKDSVSESSLYAYHAAPGVRFGARSTLCWVAGMWTRPARFRCVDLYKNGIRISCDHGRLEAESFNVKRLNGHA